MARLVAVLAAVALAEGCGDGDSPVDPPLPTTVAVSPATADLSALGATVQLTAEVLDQNGEAMAGMAVNWSSGDPSVATVDASGLVTAVANGSATITATVWSASGSAAVTVTQEVVAVAVSPAADTVAAGDTLRLAAEAADANGHPVAGTELDWASGDTLVAWVDNAGVVTGIGLGEAEVTATAAGVTGRVKLTVVLLNGVVLPGTVWVSADIITEADPSALDGLVYVGRGIRGFYDPFEGERRWREDLEVCPPRTNAGSTRASLTGWHTSTAWPWTCGPGSAAMIKAVPSSMATTTIKSTYSLDVETVRTLETLAARWNVSKSEVLRCAIRTAAAEDGGGAGGSLAATSPAPGRRSGGRRGHRTLGARRQIRTPRLDGGSSCGRDEPAMIHLLSRTSRAPHDGSSGTPATTRRRHQR